MTDGEVDAAVEALRAGLPVVLPTDTVYGLCAAADDPAPGARLYALKGRGQAQPSALLAADLETLFLRLPELRGRTETVARALLPGPYTLVVANPAGRYPWLTGENAASIGVRVPRLPEPARYVVKLLGAIVATSANLPGGPDPRVVDDIPLEIREGVAAIVDAGPLPGTPSTVLDLTGDEPRVLREGAVPAGEALARIRDALARAS